MFQGFTDSVTLTHSIRTTVGEVQDRGRCRHRNGPGGEKGRVGSPGDVQCGQIRHLQTTYTEVRLVVLPKSTTVEVGSSFNVCSYKSFCPV